MTDEHRERQTWLWVLGGVTAVIFGLGALGAACGVVTVSPAAIEPRLPWCQETRSLLASGRTRTPDPAAMLTREPGTPDAQTWEANKAIWDLEFGLAPELSVPPEILVDGKLFVAGLERHDGGEEPTPGQVAAADRLTRRIEGCAPAG
jgi:hypothetical protein